MKARHLILTILLAVLPLFTAAQNVSDLILAEILAVPDSTSLLDDYGRRSGWIELYNTSTGTVSYGGCFLTDDRNNLKKSPIPGGDLRTKLGPRQSVIFYTSGNGADGTFYTSFVPLPGSTVYLVSNDGRTIVDSLTVSATLPAGMSVVKKAVDLREKFFAVQAEPAEPSPFAANKDLQAETKSQVMGRQDPHGWILSVVAVSVVFSALAILWALFSSLFSPRNKKAKKAAPKKLSSGEVSPEVAAAIAMALREEMGGEVYAAITLALHRYLSESVHDSESFILTYRPQASRWNSKEQMFRQLPSK